MPPNTKPPVEKSDIEWLHEHKYANLEAFMLASDCPQPLYHPFLPIPHHLIYLPLTGRMMEANSHTATCRKACNFSP